MIRASDGYDGNLHDWKTGPNKVTIYIRTALTPVTTNQTWEEIRDWQTTIEEATDEQLCSLWKQRNRPDLSTTTNVKRIIESECRSRYTGFQAIPFKIAIPFFRQLNARAVKRELMDIIDSQPWPEPLRNWHKLHLHLTTTSCNKIEEIFCNVTRPWMPKEGCKCKEIQTKRTRMGYQPLPETEGHILFISRDYTGPNERALRIGGQNTPYQSMFDVHRAWESVSKQLPTQFQQSPNAWKQTLKRCLNQGKLTPPPERNNNERSVHPPERP